MKDNEIENLKVQDSVLFNDSYRDVVQKIVQVRKEAGFTQQFIADWVGVDRRKIIALETAETYDFDTLLKVADKLCVEISLNYFVH